MVQKQMYEVLKPVVNRDTQKITLPAKHGEKPALIDLTDRTPAEIEKLIKKGVIRKPQAQPAATKDGGK